MHMWRKQKKSSVNLSRKKNTKTVYKEWAYALASRKYRILRTAEQHSFESQYPVVVKTVGYRLNFVQSEDPELKFIVHIFAKQRPERRNFPRVENHSVLGWLE